MQKKIRQFHRWTSIVFTATAVATFIALALENPVEWVSYTPLLPLFLLMVTGLYLFALPYTRRRVSGARADR
ncbi:hypothetical protein SAMN04489716_1094 [Actinoplanes derwentensis]|uniref:Uncharacterized protein n=1 Tax=Actinoplanes derwentensis TaxID=113562 RepID=A0A1H1TBS0_9ACTN|nr:hypothetical protein Ade03nite_84050 [Actinoplanes derwentensis]SDS57633.1 hypothetical protein SAMN04489716_1094 [Actinoplanes derwentensis]